jgi:hypothetical protein
VLLAAPHQHRGEAPKQHLLEPRPWQQQAGAGSAPPKQRLNLGSG